MPPAMLNLNGKRFVVLPEKEYRALTKKSSPAKSPNGRAAGRKRRPASPTKQDLGDIAEVKRRMAEPGRRISHQELIRTLGL